MDLDKVRKAAKMMRVAQEMLSGGPLDYYLTEMAAAHELLMTRYAPFKVGDRVRAEQAERDIALKTERYQDALESFKDSRWTEVAAMEPEAIASLLVQKLGKEKFYDLIGTFLFDPLAEAEFASSLEADDEMEHAA